MRDHRVLARSLASTVRFDCPGERIAEALAFVRAEPEMAGTDGRIIDVRVQAVGARFYDFGPPYARKPGAPPHIIERAHAVLRRLMLEEAPRAPLIHGGSLLTNGRRLILCASKGAGKTTLLLKCLSEGMAVEADEHVIVRDGEVIARPRTLRVKEASIRLVPELEEDILAAPSIQDWSGSLIYSVAPQRPQLPWKIAPGPAHALVFLEPNHGGLTSVRPLDRMAAFERLLRNTYLPDAGRGAALARLHVLARDTRAFLLTVGAPERAVWHLRQISLL